MTIKIADRFAVTFEVWDNETDSLLIGEGFNSDSLAVVAQALRKAADEIDHRHAAETIEPLPDQTVGELPKIDVL